MMKTKPRVPAAHPKGPLQKAPLAIDMTQPCSRCASLAAVREDFKRAQDHHSARVEQSREEIDSLQSRLDAARDFARGMLQTEDPITRAAGVSLLALLQA